MVIFDARMALYGLAKRNEVGKKTNKQKKNFQLMVE